DQPLFQSFPAIDRNGAASMVGPSSHRGGKGASAQKKLVAVRHSLALRLRRPESSHPHLQRRGREQSRDLATPVRERRLLRWPRAAQFSTRLIPSSGSCQTKAAEGASGGPYLNAGED